MTTRRCDACARAHAVACDGLEIDACDAWTRAGGTTREGDARNREWARGDARAGHLGLNPARGRATGRRETRFARGVRRVEERSGTVLLAREGALDGLDANARTDERSAGFSRAQATIDAAAVAGTPDETEDRDGAVEVAGDDSRAVKITAARRSDAEKTAAAAAAGGTRAARVSEGKKTRSPSRKQRLGRPRRTIRTPRRRRFLPAKTPVWILIYTRTSPWKRAGETCRSPFPRLKAWTWAPQ